MAPIIFFAQIYRVWVVWDDLRVVVAPLIIYLATFCTPSPPP